MFGLFKKEKETAKENDLPREDPGVPEKPAVPEAKERELTFDDEALAVPEIHVRRFARDMEYVESLLEEEEKENEAAIQTENLAFPEIDFAKLRRKQ